MKDDNENTEIGRNKERCDEKLPAAKRIISDKPYQIMRHLYGGSDSHLSEEDLDDQTADFLRDMERLGEKLSPLDRKFLDDYNERSKTKPLFNDGAAIYGEDVQSSVFKRIDFPLTDRIYSEIDKAFAQCWNNEIGPGGEVYDGFIEKYVYDALTDKKVLIEYSIVEKIIGIMLDYIKMTGGFLDD
ncbi:MAG: hypothetical protein NTY07_04495 [Bacteroidia bacterium]|nr:hypothetical protein [Bacteroidia bacterium]